MATLTTSTAAQGQAKETKILAQTELKITRRLMESCGTGDVAALQTILFEELNRKEAPARIKKARDANGKTLLHFAAATGQLPVINFLTKVAAEAEDSTLTSILNSLDNDGATSISTACGACPKTLVTATVQRLLELGADPTLVNNNGVGPLHRAAGEGHVEVLELLLDTKYNLDLNQMSSSSDTGTALHWAASEKKNQIVELLIQKGADVNVANTSGQTPILIAAAGESGSIVALLSNAGASTTVSLPGNVTLLHVCAEMENETESKLAMDSILKQGTELSSELSAQLGMKYTATKVYSRGLLPVELAARKNNPSVVSLLLKIAKENNIANACPQTLGKDSTVNEIIAFERESLRQEKKTISDLRKSGQVIDDGTPMSVLLPQVTKKSNNEKDISAADACKDKGNGFFRTGELEKAIAAYSEGIALNGGNHILWGNRCACHLKLKKYDAAVFDASAALQIDKTWLKARTRLGQAFMGLERFEDAAVTLWEVVQKSEDGEAKERVTSMFQKCIRRAKQQAAADPK
jgi:ankyrin repeat protein